MLLRLCLAICIYFFVAAGVSQAQTVTLRPRIEANGPAVTIGDVFSGAPTEIASREIAAAPAPGQIATLSAPLLYAIAAAAGLEWTPPAGVSEIRVIRPGGARATLPPTHLADSAAPLVAETAIRRGETVTVLYQAAHMEIRLTGMRALDSGAVGQTVRLRAGERTIDAVVIGPGAARANP